MHASSAPKGRNKTAQGNALGYASVDVPKPRRGATKLLDDCCAPSGLKGQRWRIPRALPWAVLLRPFGAKCHAAILLFVCFSFPAFAQSKITLPPPKTGTIQSLVPVMAQHARCAALSDVHGLLAFGHDKTYPDAHVTLFRLDAKGNPTVFGTPITLPKPAGLVKNKNYVTGLAFHPKLPLLYVWQDLDVFYTNPPPPPPPGTMEFDHLCVFNIAKETPELLVTFCRGLEFIYGQQGGAVAIDPTGSCLFVPNLREIKNAGSFRLGRFPLDGDGLPALVDAKDPIAVRTKKLMELNTAKPLMPPQLTPIEYVHLFANNQHGSGHTLCPLSKDVLIASVNQGLLTWRPEDKSSALHGMPLQQVGHTRFVVHPTLPAIFATAANKQNPDILFRAEHAEGYLTLLPKQYVIPESELSGPPALLAKQKKVIVGGQYMVYQLDLDDKGFPVGEPIQTQVNCPRVRALIASERFERVYVAVEVSK